MRSFIIKSVPVISFTILVWLYIYSEPLHQTVIPGFSWLFPYHEKEKLLLMIGILSAQNNSAARNSIRETWRNLITSSDIKYYFLIGKHVCPIHPMDRKSDLSCEELSIRWPKDLEYEATNWTCSHPTRATPQQPVPLVTSFTFRVNYPVILRSARVLKNATRALNMTNLQILNARTRYTVLNATINSGNEMTFQPNEWISTKLEPYVLPKGFDVEVQLFPVSWEVMNTKNFCQAQCLWFDFHGAIEYTTLYGPSIGTVPFTGFSCTPFSIELELQNLGEHLRGKKVRDQEWEQKRNVLISDLERESTIQTDILYLDVIDVYKNLPAKLLSFYKWVSDNFEPTFLLKSDDDTFVDVTAVETYLRNENIQFRNQSEPKLWWWAKLRYGLPVERFGKWQELNYKAPVYPPFPCGSAYVLSGDIVSFLGMNSKWLYSFQGEDTSVGIWLSGIHPSEPSDANCRWSCDKTCTKHSCSQGQLSATGMLRAWQLYQQCGNFCGCEM